MTQRRTVAVDPSNTDQIRAWDGTEGEYWAAHAPRFDRSLSRYQDRFMDAGEFANDAVVLDVGCGTGQTTRDAARRAAAGSALGVDLSSAMLEVARSRAEAEGIANARFEQADAQVHGFERASFDVAISRMGAMFFGDPVAAFGNIARALRPGGRLVLLAWQGPRVNEWLREIAMVFAAGRDLPLPPADARGPFALSDPDRVRGLLAGADFSAPRFEDLSEPMFFGDDPDDALDFIVGANGWMLDGLDADGREGALAALRSTLEAHRGDEGVVFGSAAWLVTAHRV